MVLLTQTERSRLYENARNASSCLRRRNLSRKSRRRNFYLSLERFYRNQENPREDVWKMGRRIAREHEQPHKQKKEREDEECEVETEYEDEEEEEEEDSDTETE
jgi:hypothetical protein